MQVFFYILALLIAVKMAKSMITFFVILTFLAFIITVVMPQPSMNLLQNLLKGGGLFGVFINWQ